MLDVMIMYSINTGQSRSLGLLDRLGCFADVSPPGLLTGYASYLWRVSPVFLTLDPMLLGIKDR